MSETRKTITICGAALLVLIVAWATTPRARTPDVFSDRGQVFFPEFTDPNKHRDIPDVTRLTQP